MAHLTPDRYERARGFLARHARPLERAIFEHDFGGAPAWPALDALTAFANPDGGFGHGLEPDAIVGASGALATSVALRYLADLRAPRAHPLVEGAFAYLQATIDPARRTWRIVPEATETAPHAPWWAAEGLEARFEGFVLNPKADLVAQLFASSRASDEPWLDPLAEDVVREVEARVADGLEMHDLIGAARLVDAPHLPPALRGRLREALAPTVAAKVARTHEAFAGYGLRPLQVAPHPEAALAPLLRDAIDVELDHLVAAQADDGGWWPVWSWGDAADPAAWAVARTAWAGMLTLEALRALRAFGRLGRG